MGEHEKIRKAVNDLTGGVFRSTNHGSFTTVDMKMSVSRAFGHVDSSMSRCRHCLMRRGLKSMYLDIIRMCENKIHELED